ncbi:hypothetical protein [Muribaculum sp. NM65_B17]|uniref:hypothetical protein n=1 Tax=Muribaculum sp. NM65_B17 TaxID=2516961 RepID=UPI0010939DA8|nr:hypothetical protein [Muribaculum sp. NM65_B17]TGY04145.1 hypothetical protein E5354_07700 [Muribaculum sp. NM65_B17]THG43196.1 hypothetical protein E5985_06690 [Muribaculaceae bacterium]
MDILNHSASLILVDKTVIDNLIQTVKELQSEIKTIKVKPFKSIFNNQEIKGLLGIQDKLLKKYRDEGLLAYTQVGDKYWYTWDDIQSFLHYHREEAYALAG